MQKNNAPKSKSKSLLLGITGGIAAYKAAELVRLLVKAGIDVQVVMTTAACQFITPVTMQALSGKPVFMDMWDSSVSNGMPHIELSRNADAILVGLLSNKHTIAFRFLVLQRIAFPFVQIRACA